MYYVQPTQLLPNSAHFVFSVKTTYIFVLSKKHHIIHFSAIIIREIDRSYFFFTDS